MTVQTKNLEHDCDVNDGTGALQLVIQSRPRDLGEIVVRRTLPTGKRRLVGPWIFFDHIGPSVFPAGPGIGVRPHPHINIATVTYLFEGEILHRDSLGSVAAIVPGDINLMVAGCGIVHSERERPERLREERNLHGLQLWMVLPESAEEMAPAFFHYPAAEIPVLEVGGVSVRVMMGEAYGVRSPVKTFAHTVYVEAELKRGQRLTLPRAAECGVYVAAGALRSQGCAIPEYAMAVFDDTADVSVVAEEDTRLAVIGGEKMPPRFIEWNFVSSRKERIEQAKRDWSAQRFPKVPGDDQEFIPYPTKSS